MKQWVIDFDDFSEDNSDWNLILKLKRAVPKLNLNLFTIPGKCSNNFLRNIREIKWIRLYPHGYMHRTSRECELWTYEVSDNYLKGLEKAGWVKLWKSPGWQSSQELLQCLADRKWIIADQSYNDERRPKNLRAYILDTPNRIHGHIGHLGAFNSNSLELIYDQLTGLKGDFMFIDDLMRENEKQD